jgi:hypothetical protein
VYLGHREDSIPVTQDDLTLLYASSDQFPLNYLGVDPSMVAVVWLDVDAVQSGPNAVASFSQVDFTTTSITTLSLPGHPGALGFVGKSAGSSVLASCQYGDYSSSEGTVSWTGTGSLLLAGTGGAITVSDLGGGPDGWVFSQPRLQPDGSWVVTVESGVPATDTISSVTASPGSIVDDGVSASVITATVLDGSDQPAGGVTVNWSTTLGNLSVTSSVTGSDGHATTTLTDSGVPGTATVTATITGSSQSATVIITDGAVSGHIKVMGARRSNSYYYHQANSCSLVAMDSVSLQPVECQWRYDGEVEIQRGYRFTDTSPGKLLSVVPLNGSPARLLNPGNIAGNGYDNVSETSFAARMDGG